ncbi:MAG: cytidylate kinase-like family protein [Anaerolineaceae bacterium]
MAIITISRELGSGGGAITQMILNSLKYQLVDKTLIERVMSQYGMVSFDKVYDSPHNIWSRYDNEYKELVKLLNKTIMAFAKYNNTLIVGRGGFVVLHDYRNVLNVLIRAPFDRRVRNAMETEGISDVITAENTVKQNDHVRESFLQAFYGVGTDSAQMFDLVIDTSKVPLSMAGRWIMEAAQAIDQQMIKPEYNSLTAQVDSVLAKTIEEIYSTL